MSTEATSCRNGAALPDDAFAAFECALAKLPAAYRTGMFDGKVWGSTVRRSLDGRRVWLFARELGGTDIVSFNLYRTAIGGCLLKPCEMSSDKVMDFVIGFRPLPE